MKNFAKKSFTEKKTWGVLGKIQEFYSPEQFQDDSRIVPLNANPLEAWDSTRSRYRRRVQGPLPNDGQQAGTVIGQESPTPVPDVSPTPTPSFTPTQTMTPTVTPSSTPYILPETPALWYDSTNVGSIDYISSGGTDYVQTWRSIGTYQKALSGLTTDTMPVWTGSSQMPGSPLIVKFNKNATATLRDYLTQRFDNTVIPNSGMTIFYVVANPGLSYSVNINNIAGFGFNFYLLSGNTTTGGFTPLQGTTTSPTTYFTFVNNTVSTINAINALSGITVSNSFTNFSATSLNDKFLYTQVYPYPSGNPYFELNQSGGTLSVPITGGTSNGINQVNLGAFTNSGGTITQVNAGVEMAEIMVFNRELSPAEQEQVQEYLKDKWRYDEWASPVPTATPTGSPTQTPTNTQTNTPSPTQTPSATPPPFSPSGLTDLQYWYLSTSGASVSSWTNYGLLGGSLSQGTGSLQPQIQTGTLGSYTGQTVQYTSRDNMLGTFSSANYSSSTVFAIMKISGVDANGWSTSLYSTGANNVSWDWQSYNTSSTSVSRKTPGSSVSPVRTKTPLLLATSGTSGSFFTASFNDGLGTSGTTTYTGTSANTLAFGYDPGVSSSTNIEMFEFLVYNRVLSSSEYGQVMSYLKTKYNYNTW
jgi:hypothetical protein